MRALIGLGLVLALGVSAPRGAFSDVPPVEGYLVEGKLAEAETAMAQLVAKAPKDDQARFSLGVVRFLRGVERLSQDLYGYGFLSRGAPAFLGVPMPPLPRNPEPRVARYADVRAILSRFVADLASAETTLAEVTDPSVKLPLHFGLIRLDFDGNGTAGDDEALWKLYARLNRPAERTLSAQAAAGFQITFDRGDVAWLRGYCHLLMAMCEVVLAHDFKDCFDRTGHLFFAKTDTPFGFLASKRDVQDRFDYAEVTDVIALIHLIRLPVAEPKRLAASLDHLKAVMATSRESWKFIADETDDDHEWVPNPNQSTVMPNGRVTREMIDGWMSFLDEAEALLDGKKLVPFWRDAGGRGVNLHRAFTEPTTFDLVLWVQGTAAAPYLEEGEVTKPETWQRFQRVFRGEFIGFAFWFN